MFQLVKRVIPPSKVFKGQLPLVRTHISFLKFTERLKKTHTEREREKGKIINLRELSSLELLISESLSNNDFRRNELLLH